MEIIRNNDGTVTIHGLAVRSIFVKAANAELAWDWNKLSDEHIARALDHGPRQILGDAAATKKPEEKAAAVRAMLARVMDGKWRQGGGGTSGDPVDDVLYENIRDILIQHKLGGKAKDRDALAADTDAAALAIAEHVLRALPRDHVVRVACNNDAGTLAERYIAKWTETAKATVAARAAAVAAAIEL